MISNDFSGRERVIGEKGGGGGQGERRQERSGEGERLSTAAFLCQLANPSRKNMRIFTK